MEKYNIRRLAVNLLCELHEEQGYSNLLLQSYINKYRLNKQDRNFLSKLVYGVLENQIEIDFYIRRLSKTRIGKINKHILNAIRIGVYQIEHLDRIPNSAAVNESVKIAKKTNSRYSGFVNGVLRGYIRDKGSIKLPKKDSYEQLSIQYSHPIWLVEKWVKAFGLQFAKNLMYANNQTPDMTLRVNTLKVTREELIDLLKEEGLIVRPHDLLLEAVVVEEFPEAPIHMLKAFEKGLFTIQDLSSMMISKIVDPKPGSKVLDVCSAPGGKTTHMAQLMADDGEIVARDVHEHKIPLIVDLTERLGISIVKAEKQDGVEWLTDDVGKYDRVLLDAPCSGHGIIRRKPEIRYHGDMDKIMSLQKIQRELLNICSNYVKVGGQLVYSTCTIEDEENEGVITAFLESNDQFELEVIDLKGLEQDGPFLKLYPNIDKMDGFFACKMTRVK